MEVAGRKVELDESDLFCEPCQVENKKTEANGACRECKEYMCTTCFRHHLKGKLYRNHVFLPTGELSTMSLDSSTDDVEKCEEHDNEPIKFYCREHDIVGCGDCIVLGHATCKSEYIKKLAKTFENGDEFKQLQLKLKKLEKKKIENENTIQKNRKDIELINEKTLKEIRQFRSDINMYLDKAEANIVSEVEKLAKENTEMQRKFEEDVKALKSEIEEVKQKLNTELHQGNALFINAIRSKSKLDAIEKTHVSIKQTDILKRFKFIRDESISGILQAEKQFGKLRVDSGLSGSKNEDTNAKAQTELHSKSRTSRRYKRSDFVVRSRVCRGRDWEYGNQDGGGLGSVVGYDQDGWATVSWDNGGSNSYRIGQGDAFDIDIV